ncbi:MAG: adenylosuccinate lyase [Treponema sp.]|nr:adenylosuccinate lyase [Treponema sp.]
MSLTSVSPVDGRYEGKTKCLSPYFSEMALMKYRVQTEIHYLIKLLETPMLKERVKSPVDTAKLLGIIDISEDDAAIIKAIETKGYEGIPATNHDVKAVEYFIKKKLTAMGMTEILEYVHFALTSEDINNISYGLMIRDAVNDVVLPEILKIYETLYGLAYDNKDLSMLARTHGQPATPVTFGKEILVFVNRIKEELLQLGNIEILLKLNGATGGFNAHNFVFPDFDWITFSHELIDSFNSSITPLESKYMHTKPLKVRFNPITPQIEPHDSYLRVFDCVKRINNVLIDFAMDTWRYISDGWIKQRTVAGEIGSSAMPHKVNPIDFENAEGNFGFANAMFEFFVRKLCISRLQRDLTDSTVARNFGAAFAHSMIGYASLQKGLSKIEVNADKISDVLANTPEVLAEAYQNLLRMSGVDKPYERLKEITRGKKVSIEDFHNLARGLDVNDEVKNRLLAATPATYTGLSSKIVEQFEPKIN